MANMLRTNGLELLLAHRPQRDELLGPDEACVSRVILGSHRKQHPFLLGHFGGIELANHLPRLDGRAKFSGPGRNPAGGHGGHDRLRVRIWLDAARNAQRQERRLRLDDAGPDAGARKDLGRERERRRTSRKAGGRRRRH